MRMISYSATFCSIYLPSDHLQSCLPCTDPQRPYRAPAELAPPCCLGFSHRTNARRSCAAGQAPASATRSNWTGWSQSPSIGPSWCPSSPGPSAPRQTAQSILSAPALSFSRAGRAQSGRSTCSCSPSFSTCWSRLQPRLIFSCPQGHLCWRLS